MRTSARLELRPDAPYSLALTLQRFARFPEAVDRVEEDGSYRRLLIEAGQPLLVSVRQTGPPSRPRLAVSLQGRRARTRAAERAARAHIERALGTGHDLRGFYRRFRDDELLGPPIRAFRGLGVAGWAHTFESLVTTILAQQVNLVFAYSIRSELAQVLGRRARFYGRSWTAFPSPERVARETPAALRRFRLSRAKAEAIHRVARAFESGDLDDAELRALPDDEVIERLIALKGIGRWTAETTLQRGLGRRDAFPAGDLGIVKYLAQGLLARETASEAEMREFSERWRPYRSYALVYAYAELARRQAAATG